MKKSLVLFLLLLFFSRCIRVDHATLDLMPAAGQPNNTGLGLSGGGDPQSNTGKPSLTKPPVKPKGKKIRKRKVTHVMPVTNPASVPGSTHDSLFISHLRYLRSTGIEPDMNEPLSRDYLFQPREKQPEPAMIKLSRESFLVVGFDNDILDYTDRFYTNGIRIAVISPALQMNPVRHLLLPYWRAGTNYYGLSLVQNMFTPSTTKTGGILRGDRPYAAYLYVGSFKITNDPVHKLRQTSELDVGIIGQNSYGEWVQRSFHNTVPTNNEPLGWEYQVQNDLVLNYSVAYEKGIFEHENFDLQLFSEGMAGTLYTNFSFGGQFRAGLINPYFANLGVARKKALGDAGLRKVQVFFFARGSGKLVGYDATLQGGIFNSSSAYTLPSSAISRAVFEGSGGISFSCNGIRLDLEQYLLSPEYKGGLWHKWVHVGLTFSLHR